MKPKSIPGVRVQRMVGPLRSTILIHVQLMLWITRAAESFRGFGLSLQDRLLSVVVARGTNPMLRLSRSVLWLQGVNKKTGRGLMKLVTLTLLFPPLVCFKLLLEVFIYCQECLLELRQNQLLLGQLKYSGCEFKIERRKFSFVACADDCLRYVYSVAYGGGKGGDFIHGVEWPNDPSSATASAARVERTVRSQIPATLERTAERPFAAAHG